MKEDAVTTKTDVHGDIPKNKTVSALNALFKEGPRAKMATPTNGADIESPRSLGVAYAYWCLSYFGFFGLHRFYCRDAGMGVVYILTLGLFTVGAFRDLFVMQRLVDEANLSPHDRAALRQQRRQQIAKLAVQIRVASSHPVAPPHPKESGLTVGDWFRFGISAGITRAHEQENIRIQKEQLEELKKQNSLDERMLRLKEEELRRRK